MQQTERNNFILFFFFFFFFFFFSASKTDPDSESRHVNECPVKLILLALRRISRKRTSNNGTKLTGRIWKIFVFFF
jgi:hypothetical protein